MGHHPDQSRGDHPGNFHGSGDPAHRHPLQQPAADPGKYYPGQSGISLYDQQQRPADLPSPDAADRDRTDDGKRHGGGRVSGWQLQRGIRRRDAGGQRQISRIHGLEACECHAGEGSAVRHAENASLRGVCGSFLFAGPGADQRLYLIQDHESYPGAGKVGQRHRRRRTGHRGLYRRFLRDSASGTIYR